MAPSDSSSKTNDKSLLSAQLPAQDKVDLPPPVGITPPQILAQDAAAGRRGAAWRLLYWIMENDPRAIVAVASIDDDRLARHLLEFIALGTWAGKRFVVPPPLRTAYARTRLRTLFLPRSGMETSRAERVLVGMAADTRPAIRDTAIHILGIIGSPVATPTLIASLRDPQPAVRMQAVKALGRVGDPSAVPALLKVLSRADEQMGSQICSALVLVGQAAVPGLIEASASSSSPWIRWNCIRAMGEIGDSRALPIVVQSLADPDHAVAWIGAKSLVTFGKRGIGPLLRLLMTAELTPWLIETASFVLGHVVQKDPKMKPYLEPVVRHMKGPAHKVSTPVSAQKALSQLIEDGFGGAIG